MSSKKKKGASAAPQPGGVISTGGEIDAMTMALVEAICDREGNVQKSMSQALTEIGLEQEHLVLSSCSYYLTSNKKAARQHRVLVLEVMHAVLKAKLADISVDLGRDLVTCAIGEIVATDEVKADWQQAASTVLVELGSRFGAEALDALMLHVEPNKIPHFYVFKSLGDLAVANPQHVVPGLKTILGRLLPLLGSVKHDNQRWVFAASFGRFCQAVSLYLADAPDSTAVTKASFHGEALSAMELMFNQWMESKDVRLAVIEAIGHMTALIARETFESWLPRLVVKCFELYKKSGKTPLPITQGLALILRTSIEDGSRCLDCCLKETMAGLHPLVCIPVASDDAEGLKNRAELLRCYEIIGRVFVDYLVDFLLRRCEDKIAESRVGTLIILKHLVEQLDEELTTQKSLIVAGLKPLLPDDNLEVRRALLAAIVAMANKDYLGLEGGEFIVESLVDFCAIPDGAIEAFNAAVAAKKKPLHPDLCTPEQLRNAADAALQSLTTSIPAMQDVFYPFLLETVVPARFTAATAAVSRALTYIADFKRDNSVENYYIDFDHAVNVPKPQVLIARWLTLLSAPHVHGDQGVRILEIMLACSEILHPSIADMWFDLVPKLIKWLGSNTGAEFKQAAWEELILRFLSLTLDEVADDDWTLSVGAALCEHFALYEAPEFASYKRMVHKLLGTILKKTLHKKFVREKLDLMFQVLKWDDADERMGFAQGYGTAAATHLDAVLEKLQQTMRQDMVRKSTGFLGLKKDKSASDVENIRCAVILSFGYAVTYADKALIQSRVEVHIINHLLPQYVSAQLPAVQEALVLATDLIGKALHPAKLESDEFVLKQRDELVRNIIGFVVRETTVNVRKMAVACLETLVRLTPAISRELSTELLSSVLPVVYDLSPRADGDVELIEPAQAASNAMLLAVLAMEPSLDTLLALFRDMERYVAAHSPLRRLRSVKAFQHLATKFVAIKRSADEPVFDAPAFNEAGHWVALMLPRCTDPAEDVRISALSTVELLLYIDQALVETDYAVAANDYIAHIATLKDRIRSDEVNTQFAAINELTRVLVKTISPTELPELLQTLVSGLTDPEPTSANGTCVVLNGLMRARGGELEPHIVALVTAMLAAIPSIKTEQSINGTLHALRTLATHHLIAVVDVLLATELPYLDHVTKSLQTLGRDAKLNVAMINHLKDTLNNDQPYAEERLGSSKTIKTAKQKPLAATAAISALFDAAELEEAANTDMPALLSTLLLRVGAVNEVKDDAARTGAVEALRRFLTCAKCDDLMEQLEAEKVLERLFGEPDVHTKGLTDLARGICAHLPEHLPAIYAFLAPFVSRNYVEQRLVVASIFAAFIDNTDEDKELLRSLVNTLLVRISDEDVTVKIMALRGLGNVSSAGAEEVTLYSTTLLSSLMGALADPVDAVQLESMEGLSKVLALVDERAVAPVLIPLVLRLKPAFRSEHAGIRCAAFTLFGTLSRLGRGPSEHDFFEQLHASLVTLVVHADDADEKVSAACRASLAALAPLARVDAIRDVMLAAPEAKDYRAWCESVAQALIAGAPDRLNYYVMECVAFFAHKSWHHMKANAATLTGLFVGNMDERNRRTVNLTHVCAALIALLREPSAEVRTKGAEAIALMYDV